MLILVFFFPLYSNMQIKSYDLVISHIAIPLYISIYTLVFHWHSSSPLNFSTKISKHIILLQLIKAWLLFEA